VLLDDGTDQAVRIPLEAAGHLRVEGGRGQSGGVEHPPIVPGSVHARPGSVFTGPVASSLEQLLTLGRADVERLLRLRPDAVVDPAPRDLRELAERLDAPDSVSAALHTAELPVLQLTEALLALQGLRGPVRRADLLALVVRDGDPAVEAVDPALGWLADRLLISVADADDGPVAEARDALWACFDLPLGLDGSARGLLAGETVRTLQDILTRWGLPRAGSKAEALAAVVEALSDADAVRAVVASGPPDVATWLARHCGADATGTFAAGFGHDVDPRLEAGVELGLDGVFGSLYDPEAYRRERAAATWAAEHGLVVGVGWGGPVRVPGEVALAVRGPAYRAPFTPEPPAVPTLAVSVEEVERESAASCGAFAELTAALLDSMGRTPLPTVKAGGVGARELSRVAKVLGTGTVEVRLALELARACGLLLEGPAGMTTSPTFAAWRDEPPARRLAALLLAWWRLGGVPTADRDMAARPLPAAAARPACRLCAGARQTLLATLRDLPPGTSGDLAAVGARTLWRRPLVHAGDASESFPFGRTWREGEILGVVSRGALSPLGRALVDEAPEELTEMAAALLPSTTEEAVFGGDLTVVAAGAPSARVTRVLDAVADREGRGGAVVWRITPGSVRRALDEGISADELERDLAAIARNGLPQPLRYLLQDVGRRHGELRVRALASCLRSEDAALVAQVAADRSLRRLGLQVLAPTVLGSSADAETTVEALRSAGYLPVAEGPDGALLVRRRARPEVPEAGGPASVHRAEEVRRRETRHGGIAAIPGGDLAIPGGDLAALADELVRAGDPGPRAPASVTEARVRAQAPQLTAAQAWLLGHAVDTGTDVVIDYVAASGSRTRRRVGELELVGGIVQGWCHLRQDERYFSLAGIEAVHPAPPD
jgi:Helicase conserved C-terminal domain